MFSKETIKNLPNNNRFYVLIFAFLISVLTMCWLRIQAPSDQLYYQQLQESFGFLAVIFLYATLIITPIQKIIGKPEWLKNVIFARRGLGMAVLYFAILHVLASFFWQIGGFDGLANLPDRYIWPLLFGLSAVIIFIVMGVTSFDNAVRFLGYPRWKWVQRLTYPAGLLVILHAWAIGAHYGEGIIPAISFWALVALFGLESWRTMVFFKTKYQWSMSAGVFIFIAFWVVWVVALNLAASTRPASAHMFIKDPIAGAGAVLHITPDDDPVAGEQSGFLFDIKHTSPVGQDSSANLAITDEQNNTITVPTVIKEGAASVKYTFAKQGLYKLVLTVKKGEKQTHIFTLDQRVSRGIISGGTTRSTPLWAGAGLLVAGLATIIIAALAIARRSQINTYSKL